MSLTTTDASGAQVHVAEISCTLRLGKSLTLSVELMDPAAAIANATEITEQAADFFATALARAVETGIPVPTTL